MKRFFSIIIIAVLLSGCPDTKLPNPTPMVPAPKAADNAALSVSETRFSNQFAEHKSGLLHL